MQGCLHSPPWALGLGSRLCSLQTGDHPSYLVTPQHVSCGHRRGWAFPQPGATGALLRAFLGHLEGPMEESWDTRLWGSEGEMTPGGSLAVGGSLEPPTSPKQVVCLGRGPAGRVQACAARQASLCLWLVAPGSSRPFRMSQGATRTHVICLTRSVYTWTPVPRNRPQARPQFCPEILGSVTLLSRLWPGEGVTLPQRLVSPQTQHSEPQPC